MNEPVIAFTEKKRRIWKEAAEDMLINGHTYGNWRPSRSYFARACLRYERTLQAKDAQIEALAEKAQDLVTELSDWAIDEARQSWGHTNANVVQRKRDALQAAIKEATNG